MTTMGHLLLMLAFVAASPQQPNPGDYIGVGGCMSSLCHGATKDLPADSRILGTEYAIWHSQDTHAHAYKALTEDRGKQMAKILRIADDDATKDERCTVCHVVGSPEKSKSDGVACEACHGPALKWLGPHTKIDPPGSRVNYDNSVSLGMFDTRDPVKRVEICLGCHLGNPERKDERGQVKEPRREVDHELIAAGHPDLPFELITFTAAQPAHHRPRPAKDRARAWAVGQAAILREAMLLLKDHAEKKWPEFSDLECYQCHHDLRQKSGRILRGYGSRTPGSLQLNQARFEVLRDLVTVAAPDQQMPLETGLTRLTGLVEKKVTDGTAIAREAESLANIAALLIRDHFAKDEIDAQAVLRAIGADIERIAAGGPNAAEQATLTLDALGAVLNRTPDALAPLYDYLERPSTYEPAEFVKRYRQADR